jgi:hypothetical protein
MQLDPEEAERLDSWLPAIAQELRPGPVAPTAEGIRIGRKGSLASLLRPYGTTTRPARAAMAPYR